VWARPCSHWVSLLPRGARGGPESAPTLVPGVALPDAQTPVAPLAARDVEAIAAFMDVGITEAMAQHGIPGGVLGDGRVAHAQGYGHTDLERHAPVGAASTRFDISSVSKLLTATAVVPQVEQGSLDLHTDVNTYLTDVDARVRQHAADRWPVDHR
jgi:CubicO group peptidase (beta-lactamase class C family)